MYNTVSAIGTDGAAYITHYDSQGRVDATVYGGALTRYGYLDASDTEPLGSRKWADAGGALASGLRQWMVEHPGMPLDQVDRDLLHIANYLAPLGQDTCNNIYLHQEYIHIGAKLLPEQVTNFIDKLYGPLTSFYGCK